MIYRGVEKSARNGANGADDGATALVELGHALRGAGIVLTLRGDGSLHVGGPLDAPGSLLDAIEATAYVWRSVLLGHHTGHVLAPCDRCDEWSFVERGNRPKCRMTPHCPGHHRGIDLLGPPPARRATKAKPEP